MNTTRRAWRENAREQGFSLVEMSIVLVIIGLIIAAVAAGKEAMQDAEALRAYQKVAVPCVSQAQAYIARNGSLTGFSTANIPTTYELEGVAVTCVPTAATNLVTIAGTDKLHDIIFLNLDENPEYTVGGTDAATTVTIYIPGDA